ncbi:MAG: DUF952 domain-containing protein, partial [Litorimonas sp.]
MARQPDDAHLYKIFQPEGWDRLKRNGRTQGSALDRADGFVHLSAAAQLVETLDLHYADAATVMVAEVRTADLEAIDLRWEPSRGGTLFPHLYGA